MCVCLPRWCWHQPRHRCIRWLNDGGHWIQPPPPPPQPPPTCPSFNVLIELDLIRFPPVASVTYLAPSWWADSALSALVADLLPIVCLWLHLAFSGVSSVPHCSSCDHSLACACCTALECSPRVCEASFIFASHSQRKTKKKNTGGAESNRSVSFAPKSLPPPSDLPFTADRQTEAARTQHYLLRFAAHGKEAEVIF